MSETEREIAHLALDSAAIAAAGNRECPGDYAETDVVRDPSTRRKFRYRTRHLGLPVLASYRMPQISLSEQYYG